MNKISYNVELYPDDFVEDISDHSIIEEFKTRMNNDEFCEKVEISGGTIVDGIITYEDYRILREIFINHQLDKRYNDIYEKILLKVM